MLQPVYTRRFERDVKRSKRRGKDLGKLKDIIRLLVSEVPLDSRYYDHPLIGNYKGRRECHIEPDWLLIYMRDQNRIIFERTGTHADLF
jgi:mRNA interferase YafQ